jgi:hypothetical protein
MAVEGTYEPDGTAVLSSAAEYYLEIAALIILLAVSPDFFQFRFSESFQEL